MPRGTDIVWHPARAGRRFGQWVIALVALGVAIVSINGGMPSEPVIVEVAPPGVLPALPTKTANAPVAVEAVRILNPSPVQKPSSQRDFRPRTVAAARTPTDYQELRRELLSRD
jgi:hypothetical protein